MNFSTDKLDLLQKGMKGYNPDVYNLVGEVSSAVSQVALILLGIFFVLNLFQMIEKAHKNGGVVEPSVVMSEVLKYMRKPRPSGAKATKAAPLPSLARRTRRSS